MCPALAVRAGYCEAHQDRLSKRTRAYPDPRVSSSARGYGMEWRAIREEVLARHGIPRNEWSKYDVDHNPIYDRMREPDHRRYVLIPRLHGEHSRKTRMQDRIYG